MTIIILLIITGFILLLVEFFALPGVTLAGIGGLLLIGSGIYLAYGINANTGHLFLGSTIVLSIGFLVYALRAKTWDKLMLSSALTGNADTISKDSIQPGDRGIAISRLNPIGKARVNGQEVEARCPGQFVDPKTEIEVIEVYKTYIIVKPIN